MRFVIRNYSTSSYFAAGACRSGNGNKMRNIIGYICIAANQIIVFKKIFAVIYAQHNCPRDIYCSATTDTNDRISLVVLSYASVPLYTSDFTGFL